jgi:lipoprotein-anchoring transpeptidase ErfK/SrfK
MDLYLGAPGGEGSLYVCTFPVGLGQDDSTPAGKWMIEAGKKLIHPTYYDPHGGRVIEANDPTNPLGEYWLGLAGLEGQAVGKTSYGIHGTIEPDSIGKMASAGCIRMRNDDVAMVYDMLIEGKSTVIVKP